jgi:hypothetical protein
MERDDDSKKSYPALSPASVGGRFKSESVSCPRQASEPEYSPAGACIARNKKKPRTMPGLWSVSGES